MTFVMKGVLATDVARVRTIARGVRRWAERMAKQDDYDANLQGLCAHASIELLRRLDKRHIKAHVAQAHDHVFVLWKDYVVDVTATQFSNKNYPKVLMAPWVWLKDDENFLYTKKYSTVGDAVHGLCGRFL